MYMTNQEVITNLKILLSSECGTFRGKDFFVDYDKKLLIEFNKLDKATLPTEKLKELEIILTNLKTADMDKMEQATSICVELEKI